MTTYNKSPETTSQHIRKLEERGLYIPDYQKAVKYIEDIGYYRLSIYFKSFQSSLDIFDEGVEFDNIIEAFIFDRKLRDIVREGLERIEIFLKAKWVDLLSVKTQNAHFYLDSSNFYGAKIDDKTSYEINLEHFKNSLVEKKFSLYIKHYEEEYNDPKLIHCWGMVQSLTFGQMAKWFKSTDFRKCKHKDVSDKVLGILGIRNIKNFNSITHSLSILRNICAHYEMLWDNNSIKKINWQILHSINEVKNCYNHQNVGVYNHILVVIYLVERINKNSSYRDRYNEFIKNNANIKYLQSMGYPTDKNINQIIF
ncbi:Abi family protein [Francisella philomiragia]|uniref:Abi family protein n=1 Tax=Francisella philomiragia TaxID=28110 RepID=A0ABS1GD18_9GAMM|nr:Abi family protein [Francisella philomiragia]MBK2258718.1 Abi family protein [Francisella philomiragia]MBK2302409.1 Abi family protein [Francisella philomiragia]